MHQYFYRFIIFELQLFAVKHQDCFRQSPPTQHRDRSHLSPKAIAVVTFRRKLGKTLKLDLLLNLSGIEEFRPGHLAWTTEQREVAVSGVRGGFPPWAFREHTTHLCTLSSHCLLPTTDTSWTSILSKPSWGKEKWPVISCGPHGHVGSLFTLSKTCPHTLSLQPQASLLTAPQHFTWMHWWKTYLPQELISFGKAKHIPVLNPALISSWDLLIPSLHSPQQVIRSCCATIRSKTEEIGTLFSSHEARAQCSFFAFHAPLSCAALIISVALLDPHNKRLLRLIKTSLLGSGCALILAAASCFVYSTS